MLKLFLVALLGTAGALPAHAQADWSAKVIGNKDVDEKETITALEARKYVDSKIISNLLARERHTPAVASAIGQYFEGGHVDAGTPEVMRVMLKRPDLVAQSMAYAALSPNASELLKGFAASGNASDKKIAARMMAAMAAMRLPQERAGRGSSRNDAGNAISLDVDYTAELESILKESKDAEALEYALLAAGLDRVGKVKDAITPHLTNKDDAVAMAAQFAMASVGGEVDADAIMKAVERGPKRAENRPVIGYDPRQTPRIYAIRAAGEAKLEQAVEPLLGLVVDKDLHTAVEAVRALGLIGGNGIAMRLLELLDTQKTLWPVRVALYDAIGANPDKAAIEPLREKFIEETGRFRQDALYAILSIVAGAPKEMSLVSFDEWWSENSEAFNVDLGDTKSWRDQHMLCEVNIDPVAGFYESSIISDRPVFVLDASNSMKGAQIESLKQTLTEMVDSFPERVRFNIVDFGGHVRTLAPGEMIQAKNGERAMEYFIQEMNLTLGTRSFDAIERAMSIPGMDTVHYLSDGAPIGSQLNDWSRINYALRLLGQTAPVAVHMIYFPNPGGNRNTEQIAQSNLAKQMRNLAETHAGQFYVILAQNK